VRHFSARLRPLPGSPPFLLLRNRAAYLPLYSPPCSKRQVELSTASRAACHGRRPSLRRRAPTSALPRLQLTPGTEPSRPREAPESAHHRPKLPASCRRGTHGRRRPAPVELTPPASILKNRPAQQLPRPPTVLADPSAPLFPRRSAASAGTVRRRPPLTADRPPRAIFSRPETS